jgi:peptidoglycan/LPS O-acetylase OafA/YrhL
MNRIRSLDGIRAISILMVILGHAGKTMPKSLTENIFFHLAANSSLGVSIFFVISGYLITRLMIDEKEKTGTTEIKNFYIRRIFRIFPVFYLYILTLILLKIFVVENIFSDYNLVAYAALYLWNYHHLFYAGSVLDNANWFLGHLWSLSIEEQFYLLWPLMFTMMNVTNLKKVVIGLLIAMPLMRMATYLLMPDSRGQIGIMLHTGGDSILFGCLFALTENTVFFQQKIKRYLTNNYIVLIAGLFLFIISAILKMYFKGAYTITLGMSLNSVCIMILIYWCIYVPSKVSTLLNTRPLVYIGILSYSLYIWQELFLTNIYTTWVNRFPQNIMVVFVVAICSYYLIEKPILNLKRRSKKV